MVRRGKSRRRPKTGGASHFPFRDLIYANSYAALRDESYGIIQRAVDDMLKDRELREKIEYHAREILKAIAARL
jgi:hypothetical protein